MKLKIMLLLMLSAMALASCINENNWQQTVGPLSQPLEMKYLQWGTHSVDTMMIPTSDEKIKAYKVWYPADMVQNPRKKYPVVIFANGTGFEARKYEYIFKHMATWGFIAAGNEDGGSGDGRSSSLTLDCILKENERQGSPLYQHVDADNIGVAGHSQGGAGVFNAITAFENSSKFKAAFSQSPTHLQLLKDVFGLSYDLSKISIPTMITAMTDTKGILHDADDGEGNRICGLSDMLWMRDVIHQGHPAVPIVIARVADNSKDHGANLRESQPYLLAWMLYWLAGDQEAGTAFFGPNAEIKQNSHWQDVTITASDKLLEKTGRNERSRP